jgi:glycosyltransferase involved in cell wall biosynthesis
MKIKAYSLSDHAVTLQPASQGQMRCHSQPALADEMALASTAQQGWDLLCPLAFVATWNGGSQPEDIKIRLEGANADLIPAFVQSNQGAGILTFYPGYQFKTASDDALWVRGPINAPKDGLYPLERVVDASLLPCTVTMYWQFTRPQQTIRFAAGEPFARLLLYPKSELESMSVEVIEREEAAEAYEQAFQQMVDSPAMRDLFQRLGATVALPIAEATPATSAAQSSPGRWAAQLTNPPPVSCICPTYGRVELLEEAIYSFLQQDYPGQKEMIVLNDYGQQILCFDHPEVRIINLPKHFHSVGEKYKAAVALASHDLLFVWHDDDIYLPHRLSLAVAQFDQKTTFFKADQAWFWNDGKLSGPERNTFHGGSCWRRELFAKAHGYPHLGNGYDRGFEQRCQEDDSSAMRVVSLQPADLYYIYRWRGTASYHFSALGADGQEAQKVVAYVTQRAAQGQIPQGKIQLKPHWKSDYGALVQNYLLGLPATKAAPQEEEIPFPPPFYVIPPPPPLPATQVEQLFQGDYPRRISVILPAANESVLLKRTVDQFVATLPPNSEVIVVDNGSTDGSADFLLNGYCENVQLIQTPDQLGVSGARNRGLAQAQGEIVVFADAHLDLPERWWQPIACTLQRPEVGVVGPGIGVMGKPERSAACGQRIAEAKLRVEWLPWKGVEPYPVPTLGGGFMAMRHDTLKRAGAFDVGMPQWGSEDLEICVRYWLLGYEVWVAPAVTVLHYFRKSNPYKVEWGAVTHNLLRVALLHFSQPRMIRVINALKGHDNFAQAMAYAVESEVWQQRAAFAARRVHDDDWLFAKFAESCEV